MMMNIMVGIMAVVAVAAGLYAWKSENIGEKDAEEKRDMEENK